ncbi:MAG: HNH endonuclease signature motif containing protein [Rhodocyclaceae bacterium]
MRDTRKSSAQRGYGGKWQRARELWLQQHPLCAECARLGQVTEATVVDHVTPHRGDAKLFWDRKNWQSLCKRCHDSHKQRLEKSGRVVGCGLDGLPVDPFHPWNEGGVGQKSGRTGA